VGGDVTLIAVGLFDQAEELDWAGPWQVLASWAVNWPGDDVVVRTVAETAAPVECAKGLRVLPHTTWDELPPPDVVVYPGGSGTEREMKDERVLDRLRGLAASPCLVTSVCTGSLVLAAAGLLRNRPATTHWRHLDRLVEIEPTVQLRPDDRFVDDGDIVTASGVSAGIDMALHLVARLHSVARGADVRRRMQYDPRPPV
jgi:transcriptional regulator GlxA family with amidase domain